MSRCSGQQRSNHPLIQRSASDFDATSFVPLALYFTYLFAPLFGVAVLRGVLCAQWLFGGFTCCLATSGHSQGCRKSVFLTAKKGHRRDDTGGQRLNEGASHLLTCSTDIKEPSKEKTVENGLKPPPAEQQDTAPEFKEDKRSGC